MLSNVSWLALAASVAIPLLNAATLVQPSAYDDVSNLGFSAGNTSGISFVGTDASNPTNGTSFVSYWLFSLPGGTGPITSATFELQPHAFFGTGSSETVVFTDYTLSPALLTTAYAPNNATGLSVYNALSTGATFGQLSVQPSDALLDCQLSTCPAQTGNLLSFQLDSVGLADVNANLGGAFVIGAYLSPSSSSPTFNAVGVQFQFLNVPGPVAQLDLTSAPEPSAANLLALASLAAFALRYRRRRQAIAGVRSVGP